MHVYAPACSVMVYGYSPFMLPKNRMVSHCIVCGAYNATSFEVLIKYISAVKYMRLVRKKKVSLQITVNSILNSKLNLKLKIIETNKSE